jgi:mevalonate kinase
MNYWYSNGKVMLTGEYLVLKGALALALPVKFGQSLTISKNLTEKGIVFDTQVLGKPWFKAFFSSDTFETIESSNAIKADYIQSILKAARKLNPLFLKNDDSIHVSAQINFNINWGLGSSSTLLSNIGWWANINPFELNTRVSNGSGYDIACARSNKPIIYSISDRERSIQEIDYKPEFHNQLYFVYLGNKQATNESIHRFSNSSIVEKSDIYKISDLTHEFTNCQTVLDLQQVIEVHEAIIGKIIGSEPLKPKLFPDFIGSVKSLGAWGGDFCLVVSTESEQYVKQYFELKGYSTLFRYMDLII